MTGKRFTYDEFEDCIIDNLTGKIHWGLDDILNNKLNAFHEENQSLLRKNGAMEEEIECLSEENEKLKKDLEHCANMFTDDGKNVLLSLR